MNSPISFLLKLDRFIIPWSFSLRALISLASISLEFEVFDPLFIFVPKTLPGNPPLDEWALRWIERGFPMSILLEPI
jgi:hypothetical protein